MHCNPIHHVFFGDKELDSNSLRCMETWKRDYPASTHLLWNYENLPAEVDSHVFNAFPSFAHKTDVLRYYLIYLYGGIYADCDMESRKPMGKLLKDISCFYPTYYGYEGERRKEICLLGASPRHPFFEFVIKELLRTWHTRKQLDVWHRTGPEFFAEVLQKWQLLDEVKNPPAALKPLPENYILPVEMAPEINIPFGINTSRQLQRVFPNSLDVALQEMFPEAYTVHWFALSYLSFMP